VKALITGDKGFLGRHFGAELRRRGWDVVGCDTKTTRSQDCRALFRRDVRMRDMQSWDLVVHCAAVVGGREMIENDPLATAESLSIDAEMFRWAAVARPGRVIYFSSSAAYPVGFQTAGGYRLHEDDLWGSDGMIDPDEVYGWSKVTGELLADRLRDTGVPVTVVRPFSGYGGDQDRTYPFPAILDRAAALADRHAVLDVWCGYCVRDWVHVDDLVRATLAVADSGTTDPVNICTGRATSFYDLAAMMATAAGRPGVTVRAHDDQPQGVSYRVGDPARMLTYYTPRTQLEDGIKTALGSRS
jgi:nucleoside-diphosphate-sugar epimerase